MTKNEKLLKLIEEGENEYLRFVAHSPGRYYDEEESKKYVVSYLIEKGVTLSEPTTVATTAKPVTRRSVLEGAIQCDLSEQCGNCPERCNDCNQIADIYNHHPLYRKRDALFDIEDLQIVLHPTPNSSRDPLSPGPSIGIKWKQGGVRYCTYHYFDADDREPTIAEIVIATNVELEKFIIAANSIAAKGCERRDELVNYTQKIDRIRELLLEDELLCQLAEECSELAQAALKVKRAMTAKNYTPMGLEEARKKLIEECADVLLCLDVIEYIRKNDYEVAKVMEQKLERWVDRIENTIR